eukprot:3413011-Prorocentrum_lima.AAC.1
MTSSLVGSEMCIRDSSTAAFRTRSPGAEKAGGGRDPQEEEQSGKKKGPVSYTHLTLPTICSV